MKAISTNKARGRGKEPLKHCSGQKSFAENCKIRERVSIKEIV